MNKNNIVYLEPSCDFSITNLSFAIETYRKNFGVEEYQWINVYVSIEAIVNVTRMLLLKKDEEIKNLCNLRELYFSCDRELKPDEWKITAFKKDGTFCCIFSKGA